MTPMMPRHIIAFAMVMPVNVCVRAQDIKPLDYRSTFKKLKITQCTITQVKAKGNAKADSVVIGIYTLNATGQMITYEEYAPMGQRAATHFFQYDTKGKMTQCEIELADEPGVRHMCQLSFDTKGRLISRTLPTVPQQYWHKEAYQYNAAGVMTKSTQYYKNYDQDIVFQNNYPEVASPKENHSLNYIFDQRGLLVLRQFYNEQNKVQKSYVYQYK